MPKIFQGFQRSKTSGHCVMIRTPSSPSAQSSRYGDYGHRMEQQQQPHETPSALESLSQIQVEYLI